MGPGTPSSIQLAPGTKLRRGPSPRSLLGIEHLPIEEGPFSPLGTDPEDFDAPSPSASSSFARLKSPSEEKEEEDCPFKQGCRLHDSIPAEGFAATAAQDASPPRRAAARVCRGTKVAKTHQNTKGPCVCFFKQRR